MGPYETPWQPPTCRHSWSTQPAKRALHRSANQLCRNISYTFAHVWSSLSCQTSSPMKKICVSFVLQVKETNKPGCYTSHVPLFVSGWKSSQKICLMVCMINACTTTKSIALSNPPQCPSAKRGLAAPVNHSERLWIWDWTDCIIIRSRARTRRHGHAHTYVNSHRRVFPISFILRSESTLWKRVNVPLGLCKYSGQQFGRSAEK